MDPLNSLDSIAELIRRRASESSASNLDKSAFEKLSKARQKHVLAKQRTARDIKSKIIIAIKGINSQDPKKNQKLVGIFVENVLLWQFGDELINDLSFINLVEDVSEALSTDGFILDQLDKLVTT